MSDRLSQTVRFIEAVEQTRTAADIEDCLLGLAAGFGFTGLFGGIVPTRPAPPAELRSRILFQHFPAQWLDRYSSKGYVFRDPVIQHLFHERAPFTWHEGYECQSALERDPPSASKRAPFDRRALLVALAASELAGIAETVRARVV